MAIAHAAYPAAHLFIDVLDDDEPITDEPGNKKRRKSFSDVLIENKYKNAKMKHFKIYSDQIIASATSELEKRRRFWNEKAEQLAKHQLPTRQRSVIYISYIIRDYRCRVDATQDFRYRR